MAQQLDELRLDLEHDVVAARRDEWGIAAELQRVAETLLGMEQERPRRRPAVPSRWRCRAAERAEDAALPAPLVFTPALFEQALLQERHAEIGVEVRLLWLQRDGPAERLGGLSRPIAFHHEAAEIAPGAA